jgi:hypothetical protein
MNRMPIQKPGRSKQDYGTPDDFFSAVVHRFGQPVADLACTESNAVPGVLFKLTPELDSLSISTRWPPGFSWLNPPFADIGVWAEKCLEHVRSSYFNSVAMLVPASIGSEWFRKFAWSLHVRVYALNPRLTFKGCDQPYPKDCMLVLYGAEPVGPEFGVWRWK